MAVKHLKPTSAGRRFQTVSDFAEITCSKPEKSLLEPLPKKAGRNNNGRITTRHQGGGNKRQYRRIDFKRRKDDVPAKVATIEYDPTSCAPRACTLVTPSSPAPRTSTSSPATACRSPRFPLVP